VDMQRFIRRQAHRPAAGSGSFKNRRDRRFPVRMFVSYTVGTMQGQGELIDISARGWKIMGQAPVEVGTIVRLEVEGSQMLPPLTLDCAKVLWAKGRLFAINVEAAFPEARKELQNLVSRLARKH
jgi:PilZ domain-containing protein